MKRLAVVLALLIVATTAYAGHLSPATDRLIQYLLASGGNALSPSFFGTNVIGAPYNVDPTGTADTTAGMNTAASDAGAATKACFTGGGVPTQGANAICSGGTENGKKLSAGRLRIPAGYYLVSGPILLYGNGTIVEGDGPGATIIRTDTSGTGFSVFQSATASTCTGGVGAATTCADAIDAGTRGPGCHCYANADCQSAVCTPTTTNRAMHRVTIRDLRIDTRKANVVGIDFHGISESTIDNIYVEYDKFSGVPYTGTVGVNFSEGSSSATLGGYSNTLMNSRIGDQDVCVRVMPRANDTRINNNVIASGCNKGILLYRDTAGARSDGIRVVNNQLQSTASGQGPEVEDHATSTQYDLNRIESSNNGIVFTTDAISPAVGVNFFTGSGADYVNQGFGVSAGMLRGLVSSTLAAAPAPAVNGFEWYCTNCNPGTFPCTITGTGAKVTVIGFNHFCLPGPTPIPTP